jgi:hypothetical protein
VLGDREFHSVELARWLIKKKVYFVFRQKKDTLIKFTHTALSTVSDLAAKTRNENLFDGNKSYSSSWI